MFMNSARLWLTTCRPRTWIASISPVAIGSKIAYKEGAFQLSICLWTLLAVLCVQVGTNLANDYFDYFRGTDTTSRKGPQRALQKRLVTPQTMKKAIFLVFTIALIATYFLSAQGGLYIIALGILSVILGIAYTAGPFSIASIGLGDIFALVFFGPVATGATYFLQTGIQSTMAYAAGMIPGLLSTAILAVNYIRDMDEDRKAGRRTIPIRFGIRAGQIEYALSVVFATLLFLFHSLYLEHRLLTMMCCSLFLPVYFLIRKIFTYQKPQELNVLLADTGLLLTVITAGFCLPWS